MSISPRTRVAGWGAAALLTATMLLTSVVFLRGLDPEVAWAGETSKTEELHLGVVDFDNLLRAHRDYEKLQQIDEQIEVLQQELTFLPLSDQRRVVDQSQKRMQAAVEKARKELETEYARINQEMRGLSEAMQGQLVREGQQLQAHYQGVLEQRTRHLQPRDVELRGDSKARMQAFLEDLSTVRTQRVMARRLELEKQVQQRLEGERARVESELAAYEDQIMRENQEKKLNLQLQLQTATDAEQEAEIQQQIAAMGDQEQSLKDTRREELFAGLDEVRNREQAEMEATLESFEATLNAEVQQKAAAERNRLAGLPTQAPAAAPEVQRQIDAVRASITAEMETRKAEMQAAMQARSAEARKRLEKKQAEVEKRLADLQAQLKDLVEKSAEEVSEDTQRKMDDVKSRLEALQTERKALYDKMLAELSETVGELARKQNVPSVIGRFIVNLDCTDLTDLAMVAVKQADR
jgi:hypothetical protein